MNTEKVRKVYDLMSQKYNMGQSYEEFEPLMNDDEKRRKVYDLMSQKYNMGQTYDEFSNALVGNAVESTTQANQQVMDSITPDGQFKADDTYLTDADRQDIANTSKMSFREAMKLGAQAAGIAGQRPTAESSQMAKDYINANRESASQMEETEKLNSRRQAEARTAEAEKNQQLLDISKENAKRMREENNSLEQQYADLTSAAYNYATEQYGPMPTKGLTSESGWGKAYQEYLDNNDPTGIVKRYNDFGARAKRNQTISFLDHMNNQMQRRIDVANYESEHGGAARTARGIVYGLTQPSSWSLGMSDLWTAENVISLANKMKNGEQLTDYEQAALDAYGTYLQMTDALHKLDTRGFKAGETTGAMLPFMIQMALNPAKGIGNEMVKKGVGQAVGKVAGEDAAKVAMEKYGTQATKQILKDYGADGASARVNIALRRVGGDLVSSVALANTLQIGSTMADIAERKYGDPIQMADGHYVFDPKKELSWAQAAYKAETSAIIENFTEMMGEWELLGLGEKLTKFGSEGVGRIIRAISDTDFANGLSKVLKDAHWSGVFGEFMEEEYGMLLNALLHTGDGTYGEDFAKQMKQNLTWDQQLDTFLGVALFGGLVGGAKMGAYPIEYNRAKENLENITAACREFPGSDWDKTQEAIDSADNTTLAYILANTIDQRKKSMENGGKGEKERAIIEYIGALQRFRGLTIARDMLPGDADLKTIQAYYQQGYDGEDKQAYRAAYEHMKAQWEMISPYMLRVLDEEKNINAVDDEGKPIFDGQYREMARQYLLAKGAWDGVQAGIVDRAKSKSRQAEIMVRANDNQGRVIEATMRTGDKVHVISGDVVMTNGAADLKQSSKSIIIRKADGTTQMVSPTLILSVDNVQNTEELAKASAERAAQESLLKEAEETEINDVETGVQAVADVQLGEERGKEQAEYQMNDTVEMPDGNNGTVLQGIGQNENGKVQVRWDQPRDGQKVVEYTADELYNLQHPAGTAQETAQDENVQNTEGAVRLSAEEQASLDWDKEHKENALNKLARTREYAEQELAKVNEELAKVNEELDNLPAVEDEQTIKKTEELTKKRKKLETAVEQYTGVLDRVNAVQAGYDIRQSKAEQSAAPIENVAPTAKNEPVEAEITEATAPTLTPAEQKRMKVLENRKRRRGKLTKREQKELDDLQRQMGLPMTDAEVKAEVDGIISRMDMDKAKENAKARIAQLNEEYKSRPLTDEEREEYMRLTDLAYDTHLTEKGEFRKTMEAIRDINMRMQALVDATKDKDGNVIREMTDAEEKEYVGLMLERLRLRQELVTEEDIEDAKRQMKEMEERTGLKMRLITDVNEIDNEDDLINALKSHAWNMGDKEAVFVLAQMKAFGLDFGQMYRHEVLSHYSLKNSMSAEEWNKFLDDVWNVMPEEDKKKLDADYHKEYWNSNKQNKSEKDYQRLLADEYIAHGAQDIFDYKSPVSRGIVDSVKRWIRGEKNEGSPAEPPILPEFILDKLREIKDQRIERRNEMSDEDIRQSIAYHGSKEDFDKFILTGTPNNSIYRPFGVYTTDKAGRALSYAKGNLYEVEIPDNLFDFNGEFSAEDKKRVIDLIAKNHPESLKRAQREIGKRASYGGYTIADYLTPADMEELGYKGYKRPMGLAAYREGDPLEMVIFNPDDVKILNHYRGTVDDIKEQLDANDIRYSIAYHGSGANFDRFDHSFMSTGEGNQAYGWGTYVTTNEETGKAYAEMGGFDKVRYVGKDSPTNQWVENFIPSKMVEDGLSFAEAKQEALNTLSKMEAEKGNMSDWRRQEIDRDIELVSSLQKSDFNVQKSDGRHLYTVEIPDDNGENYLHWDKPLTKKQSDKIVNALLATPEVIDTYGEDAEREVRSAIGYGTYGSRVEGGLNYFLGDEKNYMTGEDPGAERNSKFLSNLGFVGMQVAVDRNGGKRYPGDNYVIYDENDIKILNNVRFSLTAENEEETVQFSLVTDPETLKMLNESETVPVYRAMTYDEFEKTFGKPMSGKGITSVTTDDKGKRRAGSKKDAIPNEGEIAKKWYKADENQEIAIYDENLGYAHVTIMDDAGGATPVAFNPYIHTSLQMLNDQFAKAWRRPNMVVVKCLIPKWEAEADPATAYKAKWAKNSVGPTTEWNNGPVSKRFKKKPRTVVLSRYVMIDDIVKPEEYAESVKQLLIDNDVLEYGVPFSHVTPAQRDALYNAGVPITEPEGSGRNSQSMAAYEEWKKQTENLYGTRYHSASEIARYEDISLETATELVDAKQTMQGGAVMNNDAARLMQETGYMTPNELDTRYSHVTWDMSGRMDYLSRPRARKEVVAALDNMADMIKADELVREFVPKGIHKSTASGDYGPLRTNDEYIFTFDLDTTCPRTFQALYYVQQIEKRLGRFMTQLEMVQLNELMRAYGQMIPCVYCYAENKRQAKKQYMLNYIEFRRLVKNAASDEEARKVMYGQSKAKDSVNGLTPGANAVFNEWRADLKGYNPGIKELTRDYQASRNAVLAGMDIMIDQLGHDERKTAETVARDYCAANNITDNKAISAIEAIAAEWLWDVRENREHQNFDANNAEMSIDALKVWKDMIDYANSASGAKSVLSYVPYTDELSQLTKEQKKNINSMGGLRMHSSNDFRIDYVFDYLQLMADMEQAKMKGHTYTKSPAFVEIFGNTGYRINMSIAAYQDENGNIIENHDEGFDWQKAQTLRKIFKNAGTMLMATSDEQLQWGLDTDWVDMIIPFHYSGLDKKYWYNLHRWTDYTSVQSERYYTAADMKAVLKENGIEVPKNAKAKEVEEIFLKSGIIKVLYGKNGKRIKPHFLPGESIKDGKKIPGWHKDGNTPAEDIENYKNLCADYGVHPRFKGVEVKDAEGQTIDITMHPGYIKLIKETSRMDSEQTPIQFNLDQPYSKEAGELNPALKGKTPIQYAMELLKAQAQVGYENDPRYEHNDQWGVVDTFMKVYADQNRPMDYLPREAREVWRSMNEAIRERYGAWMEDDDATPYHPATTSGKVDNDDEEDEYYDYMKFVRPNTSSEKGSSNEQTRLSVTPEMDAEYAQAYKEGDTEKAMQMVRDAFKAKFPDTKVVDENGEPLVVYHGTPLYGFTQFYNPGEYGRGLIWMTDDKRYAEEYQRKLYNQDGLYRLFADINNPIDIGYIEDVIGSEQWEKLAGLFNITPEELFERLTIESRNRKAVGTNYEIAVKKNHYIYEYTNNPEFVELLKEHGYDGVIAYEDGVNKIPTIGAVSNTQVKSAEPFVLDDNGNLIPLSERFTESDDIRYSIIGEVGASRDHTEEGLTRLENLNVAREMEEQLKPDWNAKEDENALKIKMATGWERGGDGKWRYEIPDAQFKNGALDKRWGGKTTLGDIVDSPELFAMYPSLKDIKVKRETKRGLDGRYVQGENTMYVSTGDYNAYQKRIQMAEEAGYSNYDYLKRNAERALNEIYSTLSHELQHAIQAQEGFARGGTSNMLRPDYNPTELNRKIEEFNRQVDQWNNMSREERHNAHEFSRAIDRLGREIQRERAANVLGLQGYRRLAGETEARNASTRREMTAEQKRNSLLASTEDVARPDQIYIYRAVDNIPAESERFSVANENQAIFVSNAARAVEKIQQEKATPQQWLAMLQKNGGIKAGEDKWLGLSQWLKEQDGKISKNEILEFIDQNGIKIEETQYIESIDMLEETEKDASNRIVGGKSIEELQEEINLLQTENRDEVGGMDGYELDEWLMEQMIDRYGDDFEIAYYIDGGKVDYGFAPWDVDEYTYNSEIAGTDKKKAHSTRLGYTSKGLDNKREIALTVPTIEPWMTYDDVHFGDAGEGRAIAWIRFGDARTEGDRVLFIDEIQSKRHQEGRERGYMGEVETSDLSDVKIGEYKDNIAPIFDSVGNKIGEIQRSIDDYAAEENQYLYHARIGELENSGRYAQEQWALNDLKRRQEDDKYKPVPAAPFEKNWQELAMKRMLRLAAEEGYDKIAWTPGEQQADRYKLAKIIPSITRKDTKKSSDKGIRVFEMNINNEPEKIFVNGDGTIVNSTLFYDSISDKPLSDFVGKDIAIRMMSMNDGETIDTSREKVGGDGMKTFYDQMLVNFMNKYGKQWGVKVEDLNLPNVEDGNYTFHSIDVTDQMKKDVMEGQTMFSIASEQDAEYRKAYEEGDTEKAAQMVKDAFKAMYPGTKAVNENGEPLTMYHGTTTAGFNVFKPREGSDTMGWFTTSKRDADSYAGNAEGKLYDSSERPSNEVLTAESFPLGKHFVFDSQEDLDDFVKRFPNASDYMTEREIDDALFNVESDEEESRLESLRDEFDAMDRAYSRYEREHMVDTTIGELLDNPDAYSAEDFERAIYAYDHNAILDEVEEMEPEDEKRELINTFRQIAEENEDDGDIRNIRFKSRVPRGGSAVKADDTNRRTYATYLNITNPLSIDAKGKHSELESGDIYNGIWMGLDDNRYDGIIIKNWRVGRYQDLGTVAIPKSASQIKLANTFTFDDNGELIPLSERFNDENNDIRYSFVGERAASALKQNSGEWYMLYDLGQARIMKEQGRSPEWIKDVTGWEQGADGEWRYEMEDFILRPDYTDAQTIGEAVEDNRLLKAYPDLKDMKVQFKHVDTPHSSYYDGKGFFVEYDNDDTAAKGLMHEVQHYIQVQEGFAEGANTNTFSDGKEHPLFNMDSNAVERVMAKANVAWDVDDNADLEDISKKIDESKEGSAKYETYSEIYIMAASGMSIREAKDQIIAYAKNLTNDAVYLYSDPQSPLNKYRRTAGEVEARNVENRYNMTFEERMKSLASATEDVARENQIVIINGAIREYEEEIDPIMSPLTSTAGTRYSISVEPSRIRSEYNNGDIKVYNPRDIADVQASVMRESYTHKDIRTMDGWDDLRDTAYRLSDGEIARRAVANGMDFDSAIEGWMYENAERMVVPFSRMLSRNGIDLMYEMTGDEIRMYLMSSNDLLDGAERFLMKEDLPVKESIRYSMASAPSARELYDASQGSLLNKLYRSYIDYTKPLRDLQEIIAKTSGKPIADLENALEAENQRSSKNKSEIEQNYLRYFVPMRDAVKALEKATGIKYNDVLRYLIAKHGLERNVVLAERDAAATVATQQARDNYRTKLTNNLADLKFQENQLVNQVAADADEQKIIDNKLKRIRKRIDNLERILAMNDDDFKQEVHDIELKKNRKRDYSGLTALTGKDKVSDAEDDARQLVQLTEKGNDKVIDTLWKAIGDAVDAIQKKRYESGMISREQMQHERDMFEHYIPLRGFAETIAEDVYDYYEDTQRNRPQRDKKAKGRTSLADDPLATIGAMAASAIVAGNKNLMKQRFLNMVENHPNDLATVKDVWVVDNGTPGNPIWEPEYPDIHEGMDADAINTELEQYQQRMEMLQAMGLAKKASNKLNIKWRTLGQQGQQHIITVRRNGKEQMIIINGNPQVARTLNGINNPDADLSKAMRGARAVQRFMASNFTTRNPAFVVSNLMRDYGFAIMAATAKEDADYRHQFFKNMAGKVRVGGVGLGVMYKPVQVGKLLNKWKSGTLDMNNEEEKYFAEFMTNGGETGYTAENTVDAFRKKMEKGLKDKTWAGKSGEAILDLFELCNRSVEDYTRFMTYMTSRQMGRSVQRSVADAKNITVNFNRKGSGEMGQKYIATAYLFFNAGVQSLQNVAKMSGIDFSVNENGKVRMKVNGKKLAKSTATLFGSQMLLGMIMPMVNEVLMGLVGGDDDDEPMLDANGRPITTNPYRRLTEFERRNNICIWVGGDSFIKIPIAIELRAFYGLGETMYGMMAGIPNPNPGADVVGQLADLLPVNFVDKGGLVPDVLAPGYEAHINRNYQGIPLYNNSEYLEHEPEANKVYSNTGDAYIALSRWINELSGGDEISKGKLDGKLTNPAIMQHLVEGYLGGVLTTARQTAKLVGQPVRKFILGEDVESIPAREWPVLNRLYVNTDKRNDDRYVKDRYYFYRDWAEKYRHDLNGYKNSDDPQYQRKYIDMIQSPEYMDYIVFDAMNKEVRKAHQDVKDYGDQFKIFETDAMRRLVNAMDEDMQQDSRISPEDWGKNLKGDGKNKGE